MLGIFYIIFVLQEVKATTATTAPENEKQIQTSGGLENPAFVSDTNKVMTSQTTVKNDTMTTEIADRGFFREFFDLTLTMQLVEVITKKRAGNLRMLIWSVLLCNIIFLASLGESDLTYFYTRLKLNWEGNDYSFHLTYGTLMALIGTLLMVGVFSKFLRISDAMIGIVSTVCTLISKPLYAFAVTTFMFYAGTTVDIFISTKAIAIKSIVSKVIATDELGKIFSILGILESIAQFIFPPIYSITYYNTVDVFLGAIYFLSEFLFLLTLVLFM